MGGCPAFSTVKVRFHLYRVAHGFGTGAVLVAAFTHIKRCNFFAAFADVGFL